MSNRDNELFIGKEFLTRQGRQIKHPSLIKYYANLNINKISDEMLEFIGLDLETDHKTSQLKLLGFWNGTDYKYYYNKKFINILFDYVKLACDNNLVFAWWNKLDPFVLYKQFLLELDSKEKQDRSLERFSKVSGKWNKSDANWEITPVIEIDMDHYKFGIVTAVRSSLKFFYYDKVLRKMHTCWAYDIAGLYQSGLEAEATKRLDYYTKVDKSAHLVDWKRFEIDKHYRNDIVLKSNMLDARAVYDLAIQINNEFKRAFGYYPTSLVSQGSFARAALVATIRNKYSKIQDEKRRDKKIQNDLKAINITTHINDWIKSYDKTLVKDMYQCIVESYSAGYIEAIRYGYAKTAYYADIASAYPGVLQYLYDLTGSIITNGNGNPPNIKNSYCFIRGLVNIPNHLNFIPITIKHPIHKETNIRATGEYYASYTLDERNYLLEQGATFSNETWFNIETKGKLSPIAEVTKQFVELRTILRAKGDSAQYSAKIAANSGYGILFEAVEVYEEDEALDIETVGYRAGEFWNPLYASIITARTRIMLAKASQAIENNGGKVILLMTDSIFWTGNADMLPNELWREKKTLGYFEKPDMVKNFVCLGSGRYGYYSEGKDGKDYYTAKKRGLNAVDIRSPDGIILNNFNYLDALKMASKHDINRLEVSVRMLISVGVVSHNHKYNINDLGLVAEEIRQADLIVGGSKRVIPNNAFNANILLNGLVDTRSIYINYGYLGLQGYYDATLPILRKECERYQLKSLKQRKRHTWKKGRQRYYKQNKEKINEDHKAYYQMLRENGFNSKDANKYAYRSKENIKKLIKESGN